MHTLAGSFSKPRLFLFSPSKACGGCFSLGIDSEVMYGKTYLNIFIRLENTLVLEHYHGRLSEKRVFVRPGSCDCYSKLQTGWRSVRQTSHDVAVILKISQKHYERFKHSRAELNCGFWELKKVTAPFLVGPIMTT